jgi:hypothetical protein
MFILITFLLLWLKHLWTVPPLSDWVENYWESRKESWRIDCEWFEAVIAGWFEEILLLLERLLCEAEDSSLGVLVVKLEEGVYWC